MKIYWDVKICWDIKLKRGLCGYSYKFDTVGFLPLQALVDRVEVYTGYIQQYLKQPNVPRFHKVSKRMYDLVS